MDSFIRSLVQDRMGFEVPELIPRDLSLGELPPPGINNWVYTVSGMRRSGKTYYLYQMMRELLGAGIPQEKMLYFNFADERLKPYGSGVASEVIEAFFALNPKARESGAYLFLDEIQEVPDWGLFLRRLIDTEKVTVLLTGSSSKLLSIDIATEFRGRSLGFELLPFSFRETLRYFGKEPKGTIAFSQRGMFAEQFRTYLVRGGFPDTLRLSDELSTLALQSYATQTVARDVVERRGGNLKLAEVFALESLRRSGRDFSMNKTYHDLRSRGFKVSRETLAGFMMDFADAHLAFRVNDYTQSIRVNPRSTYKVYAIDSGLFRAVSPSVRNDFAQSLETAVYLELRRRSLSNKADAITSYRTQKGYEVDFAVSDSADTSEAAGLALYQVCTEYSDPHTEKRELRALAAAMQELGGGTGYLLTMNSSETIQQGSTTIKAIPAWEWMLTLQPSNLEA
jgi:predicted AAA+ superfamily ATPase